MAMFDTPLNNMWQGFMAGLANRGQSATAASEPRHQVQQILDWGKDMRTAIQNMEGRHDAVEVHEALQHGAALFGAENLPGDLNPSTFAVRYGLREPVAGPAAATSEAWGAAPSTGLEAFTQDQEESVASLDQANRERAVSAAASDYQKSGFGSEAKYHDLIAKRIATNEKLAVEAAGRDGGVRSPDQFLEIYAGEADDDGNITPGDDRAINAMLTSPGHRLAVLRDYETHLIQSGLPDNVVTSYHNMMLKQFELMDAGLDRATAERDALGEHKDELTKQLHYWATKAVGYQGSLDQGGVTAEAINQLLSPTQRADWNRLVRDGLDHIERHGVNATQTNLERYLYDKYAGKLESFLFTKPKNWSETPPETWTEENKSVYPGLNPGFEHQQGPDGNLYFSTVDGSGVSNLDWKPVDMALAMERTKEIALTEVQQQEQKVVDEAQAKIDKKNQDALEILARNKAARESRAARARERQRTERQYGEDTHNRELHNREMTQLVDDPLPEDYGRHMDVGYWTDQAARYAPPGYAESLMRTVGDGQPEEPGTGLPGQRDGFRPYDPRTGASWATSLGF